MMIHGTQVMQAVILILEGDHPVEVKEQVSIRLQQRINMMAIDLA